MDYAVSFTICGLGVFLLWFYFKKLNLFAVSTGNGEKPSEMKVHNAQYIATIIVISLMMIASTFMLLKNVSNYVNYIKLIVLLGLVAAAAVVDLKKMIIPNLLILIGLGIRVVIYAVEYFLYREIILLQLKSDLIGFALGFGILLIVALITKGSLGFGDVKLFGVIGLTSGAICTYNTLIFSLVASALVSIALLITRKKGRKDSIPFGPCILIGYFVAIILSCY